MGSERGILLGSDEVAPGLDAFQQGKSSRSRSSMERPSILVVDDHFTIADTLADILNDAGYQATPAYEAREALQIAEQIRPQYLLTDVVMPIMNGVELAIAVRQMLPATRILLLSGQAGISDILHQGRQRGYEFELIAKPIHPEKLLEHLRKSIGESSNLH
jgi:CheY-like chemotaxis protein